MKLFSIAAALSLVVPAFSFTTKHDLTYDTIYDEGLTSLSEVACSNGEHGLLTHGYTTFESLPTFPYIGGAPHVTWNSRYCGTCWNLTYTDSHGASMSVNFTAIDAGGLGFDISLKGMEHLVGDDAKDLRSVSIVASHLPRTSCGLSFGK